MNRLLLLKRAAALAILGKAAPLLAETAPVAYFNPDDLVRGPLVTLLAEGAPYPAFGQGHKVEWLMDELTPIYRSHGERLYE